jgi:nucleoside-triphosphatase
MQQPPVFIITGKQGEGKTTLLKQAAGLLKDRGLSVFGFYAEGEWEQGLRSRFRLIDIQTRQQHLLCSRKGRTHDARGFFVFHPEAIQAGEAALLAGIRQKNSLAVLDEIGRFELEGKVWHNVLQLLLDKKIPVMLTVRDNLLKAVLHHFKITHPKVFCLDESPRQVAGSVYEAVTHQP